MPFQMNLFQKLIWIFLLVVMAVSIGALVALNELTIIIYFMIVIGTFLLSIFLSVLFGHPKIVLQMILLSLTLRIFVLIMLKVYSYHIGLGGFFPGDHDAYSYHYSAVKAIQSYSWTQTLGEVPPYYFIVTFLYHIFGPDMNIPQLINIGAAVLIVPLIYELGNRVGGKKCGITATLLLSLFPSAIFWSVSLLKDSFVTLGMVLSSFLVVGTSQKNPNPRDALLGICGVIIVSYMRPQFLVAIAIPIIIMILSQYFKGKSNFLRNTILIIMGVIIFGTASAGDTIQYRIGESFTVEGVEKNNEIALEGGSGIKLVTMAPPAVKWLVQLPFSIFAPFPWQWLSVSQFIYLLSGLEMIVWYIIYYFIWKNRKFILKSSTGRILLIYAFSVFIAVSFSLPSIGSIYRYRLAAMILLLPLVLYKPTKKLERTSKQD